MRKKYINQFRDGDHFQQSLAINIPWEAAIHCHETSSSIYCMVSLDTDTSWWIKYKRFHRFLMQKGKYGIMQQYRCIECCISYHHHICMLYFIMLLIYITTSTGRNLYHLFVPRVWTTLAKHSFYFGGTQIWNSLNPTLYTRRKLEQFK